MNTQSNRNKEKKPQKTNQANKQNIASKCQQSKEEEKIIVFSAQDMMYLSLVYERQLWIIALFWQIKPKIFYSTCSWGLESEMRGWKQWCHPKFCPQTKFWLFETSPVTVRNMMAWSFLGSWGLLLLSRYGPGYGTHKQMGSEPCEFFKGDHFQSHCKENW